MNHATSAGAAAFRRHVRKLHRESFRAAQGDQPTQVHFIEAYARYLVLEEVPIDLPARDAAIDRIRRQRLPAGHVLVPDPAQRAAQFEFWWHTMWDQLVAVYSGVPDFLPARAEIDDRIGACGGTSEMTSFSASEMTRLARTIALYQRCEIAGGPDAVIDLLLLPAMIRTELGFQGYSQRYPARPRTDDGDIHECRMLTRCEEALQNYRAGKPDIVDRIYRRLCYRLSWLDEARVPDPVHIDYLVLVDAYNGLHSAQPVQRLHVPFQDFPDEPARGALAVAAG